MFEDPMISGFRQGLGFGFGGVNASSRGFFHADKPLSLVEIDRINK
jgi:hypothetical protein